MWRRNKRIKAELKEQFEADLKVFNATGLKRESVFDVEINEEIREKAEALRQAKRPRDKELYILECINVNICPVCGEDIKEVSCPRRPGCWDILEKCTKCTWQLMLADLSTE